MELFDAQLAAVQRHALEYDQIFTAKAADFNI